MIYVSKSTKHDIITLMKKIFSHDIWKYLIAFLLPTFLVVSICGFVDNDTWYVAAEGREIVEHGIYYTDQLSMHEGLEVTVQNYGFAVIFYLIYNLLGTPGLYLMTLILNFIFMFLFYKLCMLLSNKNTKLSLILMAVTDSLLAFGFIVTRAQMIDYIILTALIYALELYIKTSKTKYLWWIPAFSLIIINLHATTWWMLFAIILAYLIDGIKNPKLHLQGYKIKPLVLISLLSLLVGLINPYGLKMITIIFTSYGVPAISNLVSEMHPFKPFSGVNLLFFLALITVIALYIFGKNKIKIRHLLLFIGFLSLGLNSIRAISELILVMTFPIAYIYKDWQIPILLDNDKYSKGFTIWTGAVLSCLTVALTIAVLCTIKNYPSASLKKAFDIIDSETININRKELKLFVNYDNGGYAEFRGYKPYLDPRAEVFIKKNNKVADILQKWEDFEHGDITKEDFLNKYNFDFLITRENEKLYNLDESYPYKLIYDDFEPEYGIRVYKKVIND